MLGFRTRCVVVTIVALGYVLPASAAPITWTFGGSMTNGDLFGGWFTFESETPDNSPTTPLRGDYSNAGLDWEFFVGGTVISPIQTQGWSGNFEIFDDIQTNEFPFIVGDHFRIYADSAPTSYIGSIVAGIDLFFEDATGQLVTDANHLPQVPPDLSLLNYGLNGWADHFGLTYAGEFRVIGVSGNALAVGEIQSAAAVPEPSSVVMLGLGIAAIGAGRSFQIFRSGRKVTKSHG
jgi:hypothetical protein